MIAELSCASVAGATFPDNALFRLCHAVDLPPLFLLKKIISQLLLPPLLPLLCIVAGLLLMRRRPRCGKWIAWGGVVVSLFFVTPASVDLIARPLEDVPLLKEADLDSAQAIVILGAGFRRFAPEYGGVRIPNRLALERLRWGARLARSSGLPVLVSGEADLLGESLENDFGITPRWLEGDSLDTRDNARLSAAILKEAGIQRVVLVTHAAHMKRAMAEFATNGIVVIPAPTGFLGEDGGEPEYPIFYYMPGANAAFTGWYATHEWIGLLAFKLRGLLPAGGSV
jgi:uncharacterized SAM-binding protein YcdF (DUF218 family)